MSGEDLVFDANNYNDGVPVTLEASADGETALVDVVVNRVTTTTLNTIDTNGNNGDGSGLTTITTIVEQSPN